MRGRERRNSKFYVRYTREYGGYRGSYMVLDMDSTTGKVWKFYTKHPAGTLMEAMKGTGLGSNMVIFCRNALIEVKALPENILENDGAKADGEKSTVEHLDALRKLFRGFRQVRDYKEEL